MRLKLKRNRYGEFDVWRDDAKLVWQGSIVRDGALWHACPLLSERFCYSEASEPILVFDAVWDHHRATLSDD